MTSLGNSAEALAGLLATRQIRIVLAESCTAGLAAASLARTPGISQWLCGSAVVYREATKQRWLGVSRDDLEQHTAVSQPVAGQMALGALAHTPEADLAFSITGHLGPDAPARFDGLVFVAAARRRGDRCEVIGAWRHTLPGTERVARQEEAASLVLQHAADIVEQYPTPA